MTNTRNSPTRLRAAIGAGTTLAISAVVALAYATTTHGRTGELLGFILWTVPFAIVVALFSRKPRFASARPLFRTAGLAVVGLSLAFLFTIIGWLLIGGWMLAWDFPVFYCWSVGALLGVFGASLLDAVGSPAQAFGGVLLGLAPLALLGYLGTRPRPGLVAVYARQEGFDVWQRVLDSTIQGNRPYRLYVATTTARGEPAALFGFANGKARDSLRVLLGRDPLVLRMIDTLLPP